ncbi:unnamed protein product, partial [Effrenium voratum]
MARRLALCLAFAAGLSFVQSGLWVASSETSSKTRPRSHSHGSRGFSPGHLRCLSCGLSATQSDLDRATFGQTEQSSDLKPVVTHFGINTLGVEMGGQRLLVDPLLVGSLVFWGQTWAFKGQRRFQGPLPTPEEVFGSYDAIVLSQGLEDHSHLPTLERIDRRMPIIANAAAAQTAEGLGFRPKVLRPGESLMLGQLRISALPGSVVGPPWQDPENGYVFEDTRPKGWSVGLEPHGNFRGPALGTSLRKLPKSPPHRLDALILPLTAQDISGYKLVNGADEAADTLEALDPVPR